MLIAIPIIALFCWLLFALAVNALPFFVGATALLAAYQSGAGPVGAIVVGLFVGTALLAGGQRAIVAARSTQLRAAIILLFAAPAAIAGYHAIRGLARFSASSEPWQDAFAVVGAITVGATAWARITSASAKRRSAGLGAFERPAPRVCEPSRVNTRAVIARRADRD